MADILFIKTSSLGDVIHHMPALSEAQRHLPGARFVWAVEEAFVPLVRLHPAISEIIPVTMRRWRSRFFSPTIWQQVAELNRALRSRPYQSVIDTQGLLKSALLASRARGTKHGYDSASITERFASAFYDVRHKVSRDLHAVDRNRKLTALSLGYSSDGLPDYGLNPQIQRPAGAGYAVLLHATARPEKEWPQASWIELGRWLERNNIDVVLPWGSEGERRRSEQIAAGLSRARIPDKAPLDVVAKLIAGARFVVGVDTGLLHLAAAFSVPLVAIFSGSEPKLTGPVGAGPIEVTGTNGAAPTLAEVLAALSRVLR